MSDVHTLSVSEFDILLTSYELQKHTLLSCDIFRELFFTLCLRDGWTLQIFNC